MQNYEIFPSTKQITTNEMKKYLKSLFGFLIAIAFGFGATLLIDWLIDSGDKHSGENVEKTIDWVLMATSIVIAFLAMFVSMVVHIALHEAGHLIAGLATGYKFLSYRLFKWIVVKEGDQLKLKRFNIAGTLGQCIMIPPSNTEKTPYFWYNAGGVIANFILMTISFITLRLFELSLIPELFFIMMVVVGLYLTITNGIPCSINGISNDGRNIFMLHKKPERIKYFANSLMCMAELSKGTRLHEMPSEWFVDDPLKNPKDHFELTNKMAYMSLQEDLGDYEKARLVAEEISSFSTEIPQLFLMETEGEHVMLELLTTNRKDIVEKLWTKQLDVYTRRSSKYSPIKLAVLYAYELLYKKDKTAAMSHYDNLIKKQKDFPNPGETKTAEDLCQHISNMMSETKGIK